MKLVVGLGNPEPEYSWTRHNVGKEVLNTLVLLCMGDQWSHKKKLHADVIECRVNNNKATVAKPTVYMNEIGSVVKALSMYYQIDTKNIMVVYDDLDLVVGDYKLKQTKGSKIHNGVISVKDQLQTDEFWHLRVGVRDPKIEMSVQKSGRDPSEYVLKKFSVSDKKKTLKLIEDSIAQDITQWLSKKE